LNDDGGWWLMATKLSEETSLVSQALAERFEAVKKSFISFRSGGRPCCLKQLSQVLFDFL
jgi:hypothetical protein